MCIVVRYRRAVKRELGGKLQTDTLWQLLGQRSHSFLVESPRSRQNVVRFFEMFAALNDHTAVNSSFKNCTKSFVLKLSLLCKCTKLCQLLAIRVGMVPGNFVTIKAIPIIFFY